MAKAKIKKNDEVLVIAGKYKGATGRVLEINKKNSKITIDKVNIVKKHVKPNQQNPDGGIQEFEAPIHISNVKMYVKPKKSAKKAAAKKANKKVEDKKVSEVKAEETKEVKTPVKEEAPKTEAPKAEEVKKEEGDK